MTFFIHVSLFPWFLQYEIRIHSTNKNGGRFKVSKVGVAALWADCMAFWQISSGDHSSIGMGTTNLRFLIESNKSVRSFVFT